MRNSRWDNKPRQKDGKPAGFRFEESDAQILSLFSSSRNPWGYKILPREHIAALLKRPSVRNRLRDLCVEGYLIKPSQPKNNFRTLIYALGKQGIAYLREHGQTFNGFEPVRSVTAHQLLTDITAASFELASQHYPISLASLHNDFEHIRPDRFFTVNHYTVALEIDMSTESYIGTGNTIEKKMGEYLTLMADGSFRDAIVVFRCVNPSRVDGMMECLKRTIDKNKHKHALARNFAFHWIEYDRHINTIPKPNDSAVTGSYQRVGSIPPFNFLQP